MLTSNATPYAQAWFASHRWPSRLAVHAGVLFIPAGPHGIDRFDRNTSNLLDT